MKKLLAVGVIVLFLGMTISSATGLYVEKQSSISTLDGNTLYVGGNGTGNYTKIQDAIDDASDGDTVFVYNDSSPYYENLIVNKSINLLGENRDTTIIDGSGVGDVVKLNCDNIYIYNFIIRYSGNESEDSGIKTYSDYNTVVNITILHTIIGINLLNHASFNSIISNIITDNRDIGIQLLDGSNNNTIMKNFIKDSYSSGICLNYANCYNDINNNTIDKVFYDGILIGQRSMNNKVINNDISSNTSGIIIHPYTQNNKISSNYIHNMQYFGICLYWGSFNKITNNIISNTNIGVYSQGAYCSSIYGNTIKNNFIGVEIDNSSYYGHIYHNNFINNTQNAYDDCINSWDNGYPSGGNYWDDYSGVDNYWGSNQDISDSDGIGDTPYDLPSEHSIDNYPLIEPYGIPKLTMDIKNSLLKLSGIIRNIGNNTAFKVQWKITIDGGFLLKRESWGTIQKPLLPGEEINVSTHMIFGFGFIIITVELWIDDSLYSSESISGILLFFFIMINPGGRI